MRPPRPLPWMASRSTLCSAASRATTGDRKPVRLPAVRSRLRSGERTSLDWSGSSSATGSSVGGAAWSGTASPACPTHARTVPAATVSPSATQTLSRTPDSGHGRSVSILSVEMVSRLSSRSTESPSDLSQAATVPSVTLWPNWGIARETGIRKPSSHLRADVVAPVEPSWTGLPPGCHFLSADCQPTSCPRSPFALHKAVACHESDTDRPCFLDTEPNRATASYSDRTLSR